jgi:transcriptional regulator with XRE-family HTH domain
MALQQTIGQTLRAFRQRKGLTQKELASKIQGEVDYSYIGKIERGE